MFGPAMPDDERTAPRSIESVRASGSMPDERFAGLVSLARQYFGIAAAVVTLTDGDRSWFGSCDEFPFKETLRNLPVCGQVFLGDEMLVVPDTHADGRFRDHRLVTDNPRFRFYAGYPLIAVDGRQFGTLCLLDHKPGDIDEEQRAFLRTLAQVATGIAARDEAEIGKKEAEDLSGASGSQMALAIAGSGTGIWDRNVVTGEIHYSAGWKAILGYAESEVTNRIEDSYRRVHPDDLAYVQATIQAHFDQKTESYEVEHRICCKDGSYKWICSRGKVVDRDSHGKPLRMIGTTTDITAMRAMSERLQQTVDLITNLTNQVPGLVFQYRLSASGEAFFSYASAGIADIYELMPEELAISASAIDKRIHPEDLATYHASLDASAASLSPWHLEYRVHLPRQGLRWRQGDARPQRLADGSTLWHGFITDVTERKRIEAELQKFATIDHLTQLPNRRHFMTQIEGELTRMRHTNGPPATLVMFDLDHFKSINDEWGHAAGDRALSHFAFILRDHLRSGDIAGRIGGEEFSALLCGADVAEAMAVARRVQQRISELPLMEGDRRVVLTVSIGLAAMNATDTCAESVLSRSDVALYRAKKGGRNRIECH